MNARYPEPGRTFIPQTVGTQHLLVAFHVDEHGVIETAYEQDPNGTRSFISRNYVLIRASQANEVKPESSE